MNITIYTAIFGEYDMLKEPLFISPKIKYVCFTDKEYDSEIWDIRIVDVVESSPRREARKYKILSHKYIDTPISLWIDGSRLIKENPLHLIRSGLKISDFVTCEHRQRNCIYDEATKCISVNKGNPILIQEQVERYREEDYPENNGLINSTIVLRRITPVIIKLEDDWWNEIKNGCVRDQVSFNYVAWKNNFKYGILNWKNVIGGRGHKR